MSLPKFEKKCIKAYGDFEQLGQLEHR